MIEAVIADPNIEVEGARILVGAATESGPAPTKDQKFADTVKSSWGRLSIPAKRDFLPEFVSLLTPDLKTRLRGHAGWRVGRKACCPVGADAGASSAQARIGEAGLHCLP